jgi:DNA-binding NtrC family response regulator
LPFLFVSGTAGEETAVAAVKAGANDYLLKDRLARLLPALERELREAEKRRGRKVAEEAGNQQTERFEELTGRIAHDFNNVLMAITGYCELLQVKLPAQDPLRQHVNGIQKALEQGARLNRQLLLYGRKGAFPEETEEVKQPAKPLKANETILVVDDNEAVRNAVGTFLELKGYKVLRAEDGEKALGMVTKDGTPIDLLITDLVMPKMGGRELARSIFATRADLKVLYMSGYTDEPSVREGNLGPNSLFVQKPTSMEALFRKVRQLLEN